MPTPITDRVCDIPGCGRKHKSNGLCRMHYLRKWRTGDAKPDLPHGYRSAPRPGREVVVEGVTCWAVPAGDTEAIVDMQDREIADSHIWHVSHGYATTRMGRHLVKLHQLIFTPEEGLQPDHKNRNRLDNRRTNFRSATQSNNIFNSKLRARKTSRFRGVSWFKPKQRWAATIRTNGRNVCLGYFRDERDAAMKWNQVAAAERGEFAVLNPV